MEDPLERLGLESMGLLEGDSAVKDELCMEIDPPFRENVATAEHWRRALDKVVSAVVVLHTTACRAFDTNSAGASYATGFVVDKRRGIILTNRHVVKTGPVVAEAMFVNREEISVHPVYRDPELEHGEFVRVRTVHQNGKPLVLTLKQDLHYWATWELRFDPDTAIWHRKTIKALDCSNV